MRRATRGLVTVVLAAVTGLLSGCSAGLTGGSIPPGSDPARARGMVVRGDQADRLVLGATLRFIPVTSSRQSSVINGGGDTGGGMPPAPPDWTGGTTTVPVTEYAGTIKTITNDRGEFDQSSLPTGKVTLIVSPPGDTGLSAMAYSLQINAGDHYYMLLALPPSGVNTAGLTGISLTPNPINLMVGQATQVQVQLVGGAPPAVAPSYLVKGNVGVVNTQGRFTATQAGTGLLRVQLLNYTDTVPVTVSPPQ